MSNPLIEDGYVDYYTEKLWAMIPELYRHEDGLTVSPGTLRALVHAWAKQAAALRRSQDRVWEDLFIELCSDWAIPYIGDLVGTRLISAQNRRGQRIDVAKTIYYRRRAGTVRVLEELIADMTGWEGVVVEGWKTLARTPHNLDLPPQARGRLTRTPRAGTADIHRSESAELTGSPFDEFFYTPDVRLRQPYGISKIGFHIYRLAAVKLTGIEPRQHASPDGQGYTFDPSGRDVPLFAPRSRPELFDEWRSAIEYELPAPIACRLLADAVYEIDRETPAALVDELGMSAAAEADLETLVGIRFDHEWRLRERLSTMPNSVELLAELIYQGILRRSAVPECGKHALLPDAINLRVDGDALPLEVVAAANLVVWEASPLHKRALIDPEHGRLVVYDPAPTEILVDYHVGVYMPLGAGGFTRGISGEADAEVSGGGALGGVTAAGITRINDSRTYTPVSSITGIMALSLIAADGQRPYLPLDMDWTLAAAPPAPPAPDATLLLDGLWIGAQDVQRLVFLDGDYETVTLRYCTFDPGGIDADGNALPSVMLVIRGFVETLVIERCVMGVIRLDGGSVETIRITDSVIQSRDAVTAALEIGIGTVEMARTTIFGMVDVLRLYATDSLVAGVVDVTDTQDGCFRFSAASPGSRLPHPYEGVELDAGTEKTLFISPDYGQPTYAMLSSAAPDSVARGGEDGAEMGVYNTVGAPFKRDGLRTKIAEFMPFGLIPVITYQT